MPIYDQHLHTEFSIDSREPMENYVAQAKQRGDTIFLTTEHMDLDSHLIGRDSIPDFPKLMAEQKRLTKQYGLEMLLGLEVGYKPSTAARIETILARYPFDTILLSIHENDSFDMGTSEYLGSVSPEQAYQQYLLLIASAVKDFKNYDVLAHVDYMIRYAGEVQLAPFAQQLGEIFKTIVADGKTLELNTRLMTQYNTNRYTQEILDIYRACGGKSVSLGSDSHTMRSFQQHFETVKGILRGCGIRSISGYRQRKRFELPI